MSDDRPECCGKKMAKDGFAGSGNQRYQCKTGCRRKTTFNNTQEEENDVSSDEMLQNAEGLRERIKGGQKRFVITAAQNNTRVHTHMLESLKVYCAEHDAELIVIPIHYKNVSLFTASKQYEKSWGAAVMPYLIDEDVYLGGGVMVAGSTKIAATAANPLGGMQEVGGNRWQIIGHSKVRMEPVAAPMTQRPKKMFTTGAVTVRNYSRTKEGKKAEFHHSISALVVEVANSKTAFVRQLGFSKGGFYDLAGGVVKRYSPAGVCDKPHRALALCTGDEHVKWHASGVYKATYAEGGLCDVIRPKNLIRHDVLDGYAGSHHHEKDPLLQFKKHHNGDNDYRAEMEQVVAFINETTPDNCLNVMVDSNHHDHLQQFLNKVDVKEDHTNAVFIAEMQLAQRQAVLADRDARPLRLYCEPRLTVKTKWLDRKTTFILGHVSYDQHGDVGVNGSRGSAAGLAKSVYKAVIGHGHSARIVNGVYQVGKSAVTMEYERGLSTQGHTHCIQWENGKRTLVDIINSKAWL